MVSPVSLESLPEEVAVHISSLLAGDCDAVKDLFALQSVSQTFRCLAKEPYVLRRVSLMEFTLRPWWHRSDEWQRGRTRFLHACAEAGNTEAKFHLGLAQYILNDSDEQQKEGLQRLAEDGDKESQFFYGSILVCLGGDSKSKGLEILTPQNIPYVHSWPYDWMEAGWMRRIDELRWLGIPMVQRLRRTYARGKCECGGVKAGLYPNPGTYRDRYDRFLLNKKRVSSISCEVCLCHYVIQLFFDVMEDICP